MHDKTAQILHYIQTHSPTEQTQIAGDLGFSLMTVNKIVNDLSRKKLLTKAGKTAGKIGRRSELFKLNPDLFVSIGIGVNENEIIFTAADSDASVISKREYRFTQETERIASAEDIVKTISSCYHRFLKDVNLDGSKVAVIGVAPEGIVDTENGVFVLGTHLGGIMDFKLRDALQNEFLLPVMIDDPARSLTYYEKKYGSAAGRSDFIYLYLGNGVGSGIVIDGKIYRGFRGIAGEVGHIIVDKNGARCRCGNYGCLETIASKGSMLRQVKTGIREGVYTKIGELCGGDADAVTLEVLKSAAEAGDKFSRNILEHVGSHIGKAVAVLVNIFNPELILLGGDCSVLGEHLLEPVRRATKSEALHVLDERTEVHAARYDRSMDSLSIAVEALDMLFENKTNGSERFLEAFISKENGRVL
jgi:predicted NBD/HSP70 family sugar kinase